MKGLTRSITTLAGIVAAGAIVWFVPHFDRWSTWGYLAGMALFAVAGAVLGTAQLRGREGKGKASFLVVFVPVLVVTAWVVLASQPRGNWLRDHVAAWSGDIGVGHVVHNLGEHVAVLAFTLGLVFGLTFEPTMALRRRRRLVTAAAAPPAPPPPAAPEPVSAEPPPDGGEGDRRERPGRPTR